MQRWKHIRWVNVVNISTCFYYEAIDNHFSYKTGKMKMFTWQRRRLGPSTPSYPATWWQKPISRPDFLLEPGSSPHPLPEETQTRPPTCRSGLPKEPRPDERCQCFWRQIWSASFGSCDLPEILKRWLAILKNVRITSLEKYVVVEGNLCKFPTILLTK